MYDGLDSPGQRWREVAVATVDAILGRLVRGTEPGTLVLPRAYDWEPDMTFRDVQDLREHLACIAHDVWAALVEWQDGFPAEGPAVLGLVDCALAAHADRLRAMGLGPGSSSTGS